MWKPWIRGGFVLKRKRTTARARLVVRVVYTSIVVLASSALGDRRPTAASTLATLLKWSRIFWLDYRDPYSRLCALACLSLLQTAFKFNLELASFFVTFSSVAFSGALSLVSASASQRRKRFFFVRQRPKRFVLWYWASTLAQYASVPLLQRKPFRVLRVLHPVSFFLKTKKLKHPQV